MSKLLRWEVWEGPQPEIDMEKGEWVRYEDARKLEEEIELLRHNSKIDNINSNGFQRLYIEMKEENERLRLWKSWAINLYSDLERMKIHDTTLSEK